MTRVLVCGGRDYADHQHVKRTLDGIHAELGITVLMVGCADGADRFARNWALGNEVDLCVFAAKWKAEGRKAGPLRNARMLERGRPDLVVAFPGGKGTDDMLRRALAAGGRIVRAEP